MHGNIIKYNYGGFFVKRLLWCGDCVESQYHSFTSSTKRGRMLAQDTFIIFYGKDKIVPDNETL